MGLEEVGHNASVVYSEGEVVAVVCVRAAARSRDRAVKGVQRDLTIVLQAGGGRVRLSFGQNGSLRLRTGNLASLVPPVFFVFFCFACFAAMARGPSCVAPYTAIAALLPSQPGAMDCLSIKNTKEFIHILGVHMRNQIARLDLAARAIRPWAVIPTNRVGILGTQQPNTACDLPLGVVGNIVSIKRFRGKPLNAPRARLRAKNA